MIKDIFSFILAHSNVQGRPLGFHKNFISLRMHPNGRVQQINLLFWYQEPKSRLKMVKHGKTYDNMMTVCKTYH